MTQGSNQPAILGVGVATVDLINEVAAYPHEDAEVRALAQHRVRGGNATNSLVVLAQLGHACRWAGTLGSDAAADFVLDDLARHGVEAGDAQRIAGARTPTSYVALSRAKGTRTIIHYRDLPELESRDFERVALAGLGWVHFEGRNPPETRRMIARVRRLCPGTPISVELEKPRPEMASLLAGPHVLLASRAYAEACGFDVPEAFLTDLATRSDAWLCALAWGAGGAAYLVRGEAPRWIPAYSPPRVVDTLGAGDVFNAGVISGLLGAAPAHAAVTAGVELAGRKCGQRGLTLARPGA